MALDVVNLSIIMFPIENGETLGGLNEIFIFLDIVSKLVGPLCVHNFVFLSLVPAVQVKSHMGSLFDQWPDMSIRLNNTSKLTIYSVFD